MLCPPLLYSRYFEDPKMKRSKFLLTMASLVGLVSVAFAQETISPEDAATEIYEQILFRTVE